MMESGKHPSLFETCKSSIDTTGECDFKWTAAKYDNYDYIVFSQVTTVCNYGKVGSADVCYCTCLLVMYYTANVINTFVTN